MNKHCRMVGSQYQALAPQAQGFLLRGFLAHRETTQSFQLLSSSEPVNLSNSRTNAAPGAGITAARRAKKRPASQEAHRPDCVEAASRIPSGDPGSRLLLLGELFQIG